MMTLEIEDTTYEAFKEEWISEIEEGGSAVEKGRRFAIKLAREWLDVDPDEDDFIYADGSFDGGIDIAYLQRSPEDEVSSGDETGSVLGDTWYLFQSKYGSSITRARTIYAEAKKVFNTIAGNNKLSTEAENIADRVRNFMSKGSIGRDKIVTGYRVGRPH